MCTFEPKQRVCRRPSEAGNYLLIATSPYPHLSRETFPDQLWLNEENVTHFFPDDSPAAPLPKIITIQAVAAGKRRGDASEAAFLACATHLGFTVCLPWGASERYDSVVNFGRGFLRVQVKSATRYAEGRYRVSTTGGSDQVYTADEIDFFVAHIVPENIWYVVPVEALGHRKNIRFYPRTRRSRGQFEKYREAWCLLTCPAKARGWKDIPVLCRNQSLPVRCAVCPRKEPRH